MGENHADLSNGRENTAGRGCTVDDAVVLCMSAPIAEMEITSSAVTKESLEPMYTEDNIKRRPPEAVMLQGDIVTGTTTLEGTAQHPTGQENIDADARETDRAQLDRPPSPIKSCLCTRDGSCQTVWSSEAGTQTALPMR